ncbi:MAG TPA: DNA alkylation repair protein [Pyrinomonadaceae bacterium]|jgi:Predicted DNA alkylation repair enzyme|nr:DNA alkylation repair protein [Pyrinomonadaceae bacterium]
MTSVNTEKLEREINERLRSLHPLTVPSARGLRREYSKRIATLPPAAVMKLACRMLQRPGIFPRFVAYELVQHHRPTAASLNAKRLESLGRGIDSWGAVDTFACYLSGPAWREHLVPESLITKWARSKDRWWRRAAVVSTVPLNNSARGGSGDVRRTIRICQLAIDDRDDLVVKALSWALRELSKRDPGAVAAFVSENQTRLAPRVLREVANKLKTGLKNPKTGTT